MRINEAIQAVRNATSEDYMTRTCAIDDADWMDVAFTLEHSLTAELNAAKNDHERYKTLKAELVVLTKDIEMLRKANGHFAQTNFELEAENAQLKRVFDSAAKRIATGTSKRLKFRCSHCQKNTPLLIDAILADIQLKDIYKNPHYSAIDATVCSDLVLREAERTYRVIDATRDTLKKGG